MDKEGGEDLNRDQATKQGLSKAKDGRKQRDHRRTPYYHRASPHADHHHPDSSAVR
jgi:hypothetical protein